MVAASAALTLSGVPFMGPIGGARVGFINGDYVLNPQIDEMAESKLDLVVAGTGDAVLMVESEAERAVRRRSCSAPSCSAIDGFQPVIDAIIKLAEKAAKEPRADQRRRPFGARRQVKRHRRGRSPRRLRASPTRPSATTPSTRSRRRSSPTLAPEGATDAPTPQLVGEMFKKLEKAIVRGDILDQGHPHRRPRPEDRPPDRRRSRRPAAHPRLGAVHPRRDPGAGRRHARHRRRRAVRRRAAGDLQGDLPAPLQLPALLGRRDRPHGFARPPRDRPRQARLARDPSGAAAAPRVPLHAPRRLRDHRVERLVVDGDGLRRLAGADGRRRAAEAAGRRHRHGPHQGGRAASPCSPTSSATRITSATWTSRSPAPPDGVTSLQMDIKIQGITEEIMQIALAQAKDGRLHILGEMAKALPRGPRASSASTRRASRSSRSRPTRSAKSSARAARSSARSSRRPAPRSTSTTTARSRSPPPTARRSPPRSTGSSRSPPEPEVGMIYQGTVVKIVDFGAFVNFFGAKDGLVHISQLGAGPRRQAHRRRQGRRQGLGQAPRLRRARQGPPVDEGRRPGRPARRSSRTEPSARSRRPASPARRNEIAKARARPGPFRVSYRPRFLGEVDEHRRGDRRRCAPSPGKSSRARSAPARRSRPSGSAPVACQSPAGMPRSLVA